MTMDDAARIRLEHGKQWLEKIFGKENIHPDSKAGEGLLIVNVRKLLRDVGVGSDDVVERLNKYVRDNVEDPKFIAFQSQEPGCITIMNSQFSKPGVVSTLGRLHVELLELVVAPQHSHPKLPEQTPLGDSTDAYELKELMPKIPASKPKSQPLLPDVAIAALEASTGVKWMQKNIGAEKCFITTTPFPGRRRELSKVLRAVLDKTGERNLSDFPAGSDALAIPASYLDLGNLGMLMDSRKELMAAFGKGRGTSLY